MYVYRSECSDFASDRERERERLESQAEQKPVALLIEQQFEKRFV